MEAAAAILNSYADEPLWEDKGMFVSGYGSGGIAGFYSSLRLTKHTKGSFNACCLVGGLGDALIIIVY